MLTIRAKIKMFKNYVIFTTITKCATDGSTTPTRVRANHVKEAANCCIFYNKTHYPLDFSAGVLYNKA